MARHELPLPTNIELDREIVRIWESNDGGPSTFIIDGRIWSDSGCWGLVAVDLMRHAARAFAQEHGVSAEAALDRMRQVFDAEWDHPTDAS